MLIQTHGGGGGDATSVERSFSTPPVPGAARGSCTQPRSGHELPSGLMPTHMRRGGGRRFTVGRVHVLNTPPAWCGLRFMYLPSGSSPGIQGPIDSARHVIGRHLTQETRVYNVEDDVASTIHQSLPASAARPSRRAASWNRKQNLKAIVFYLLTFIEPQGASHGGER